MLLDRIPNDSDKQKWEEILKKNEGIIVKTATTYANRDRLDDIVQEVNVRAWLYRNSYKSSRGAITTWLARITRNVCRNNMDPLRTYSILEDPGMKTEDHLEREEEYRKNKRLIDEIESHIPPQSREIFDLVHRGELSKTEIAQLLGMPLYEVTRKYKETISLLKREFNAEE